MLFSQGFRTAESLASKIVPFFNLCSEQLSPQPHYDFGLRALKSVLASAGILKRERLANKAVDGDSDTNSDVVAEQIILIQSVTETIVPKLVADDVPLLTRYGLLAVKSHHMLTSTQFVGRRLPRDTLRASQS
jgi:dynein heavy chain 1